MNLLFDHCSGIVSLEYKKFGKKGFYEIVVFFLSSFIIYVLEILTELLIT